MSVVPIGVLALVIGDTAFQYAPAVLIECFIVIWKAMEDARGWRTYLSEEPGK